MERGDIYFFEGFYVVIIHVGEHIRVGCDSGEIINLSLSAPLKAVRLEQVPPKKQDGIKNILIDIERGRL